MGNICTTPCYPTHVTGQMQERRWNSLTTASDGNSPRNTGSVPWDAEVGQINGDDYLGISPNVWGCKY